VHPGLNSAAADQGGFTRMNTGYYSQMRGLIPGMPGRGALIPRLIFPS